MPRALEAERCNCFCHHSHRHHPGPPCCLAHYPCRTTRIRIKAYKTHLIKCAIKMGRLTVVK